MVVHCGGLCYHGNVYLQAQYATSSRGRIHPMSALHNDVEEILIDEQTLQNKVQQLGARIAQDYAGKELVLICILKGSFIFTADLARALPMYAEMDFMAISSYGRGTKTSGVVRILKDLDQSIENKHVLIVE